MDEKVSYRPTDAYALAKQEAETQAESFVHWFPGMNVASLRIHEVAPLKDVQKEHEEDAQSGIRQLWGWVNPEATARACLLSVEKDLKGRHESRSAFFFAFCLKYFLHQLNKFSLFLFEKSSISLHLIPHSLLLPRI